MALFLLRQTLVQDEVAELFGISQATVSRRIVLVDGALEAYSRGFQPSFLITRTALLGSVTFERASVNHHGRAVELEHCDRTGHRAT
ncbi:hypothetical protein O1L44_00330 [Streptomyces noursei]|nr:hypothetical protein SNOUR_00965 [Streptomyces noursei ATCC 11455]MCZ0991893.1 hypothetical protein [Streptomyces noursei]